MNRRYRSREGDRDADEAYRSGTASATAFGGPVQDPRLMPRESALTDLSHRALAFLVLAGCGAGLWIAPSALPIMLTGWVAAALSMGQFIGPLIAVLAGTFGAIHTARYARARVVPSETPVRADGGYATGEETHGPSVQARRLSASLGAVGVAVLATWLLTVLPFPSARWMVPVLAVVRPVLALVVVACILFVLTLIEAGTRDSRDIPTPEADTHAETPPDHEQKQERKQEGDTPRTGGTENA